MPREPDLSADAGPAGGQGAQHGIASVRGLSRIYGRGSAATKALDRVSLDVAAGDVALVFGPSGSGKSTLISIMAGLDRTYEGSAKVNGQELNQLSDPRAARLRAEQIGFVFQSFHLLSHLSVLGNVTVPALFSTSPSRQTTDRGMHVLERVGLQARANDLPSSLSGGQRQRVAIARALFNSPSLFFCDEPTGNLDQGTGEQIIDLFESLHAESGATFVIVTHEARLMRIATRRLDMLDGRLTEVEPR